MSVVEQTRPGQVSLLERLREMIESGALAPGERITEQALATRFGVSRTPLREALRALASEGLVETAPNRGARVARLTPGDVDEIFPIMAQLEALAGELAAARLTEIELAELKALHYEMALHHTRGDSRAYIVVNERIHDKILSAAGNATLSTLYRALAGRVRRARYVSPMSEAQWARSLAEHEAILAALEARDGPRLSALLRDHVATKAATVKATLAVEQTA